MEIEPVKQFSVYIIENKKTDKVYIGITSTPIEIRWKGHLKRLNRGNHIGYCLYNAMAKYGCDNFIIRIIDVADTWEEACEKEIMYIQKYDSMTNGYNMTLGGEGGYGQVLTEETKKKMRDAHIGRVYKPSSLKGIKYDNTEKWKKAAEKRWANKEYRELQLKNHVKKHSLQTRKKLSLLAIKRGATYVRETIIDGIKYKSRTEACEKLGKTYQHLHYKGCFNIGD